VAVEKSDSLRDSTLLLQPAAIISKGYLIAVEFWDRVAELMRTK
jgi:hypothetical protein